jgi:ubiquinol-cytochrome c reductase cytochrome b subunit
MRLVNIPILSIINNHLIDYPTPSNINYFWGFGSLAGLCLGIQILTGILLAMHYTPHVEWAFNSVEHIMRDVNNGWLIRYSHANGASMFFIVTYVHIARGLYFRSYRKTILWCSGVIIFLLMMATAFMGYVLPWGQMSFWGATVITNLFSAIPVIGTSIATWLWGGFAIDNATLNRFFSLHYLLPFSIVGLVLTHLSILHLSGSTNPLSICSKVDRISFYPYFYVKDLFGLLILFLCFSYLVFFNPNLLKKFRIKSSKFDKIAQVFFWLFVCDVILLGWLGSQVVEHPYVIIGQIATGFYFIYIGIIIPSLAFFESEVLKL